MAEVEVILGWRGRTVVDCDGGKIGKLDEIFVDRESEKPEFALVDVGLLGLRSRFVPLAGAASVGEEIRVPYSKDQIKDAPDVDGEPTPEQETQLYRHYQLDQEEARQGQPETGDGAEKAAERTAMETGMRGTRQESDTSEAASGGSGEDADDDTEGKRPAGASDAESGSAELDWKPADTAAPSSGDDDASRDEAGEGDAVADGATTRSEEELEVSTEKRPRGRVRLKKYVVTEEVQKTVPVRREEVRVEREPLDESGSKGAASDAEIGEGEEEVVLHEEQPVVEKRTVPKERVRLDKEVVTGQEDVSDQVRKERVEVEREKAER
jgi:uncharacterized protein (TIGR02271 family)